jgi:hypothetical protein
VPNAIVSIIGVSPKDHPNPQAIENLVSRAGLVTGSGISTRQLIDFSMDQKAQKDSNASPS